MWVLAVMFVFGTLGASVRISVLLVAYGTGLALGCGSRLAPSPAG